MKVSYNWLKEFVSIDLSPEELAERLTHSGAEVERVETVRPSFSGVVVGRIIGAEPDEEHPRWSWCRVDIGGDEVTTLCAAPNARAGILTAVATAGGELAGGGVIEERRFGGRTSRAVLCSEKELELGDNDRSIIELPARLSPGSPLAEALEMDDAVLDIDVTPNRPDLLSHRGVARDIAALTGRKLAEPAAAVEEAGPPIGDDAAITIEDYELCPRYCGRLIRGVAVQESPLWLRRRLTLCGIKPVNNVVDATNYLLLELGHPLHAFDHHRLTGGEIIVRPARPGETIRTIDGAERSLSPPMLVIADAEIPVAVAGVMGGLLTEIGDSTSTVLLESAYFDPVGIRRTARTLSMSTEASRRFERGADPLVVPYALDRAAALILKLAGGAIAPGIIDRKEREFKSPSVSIRPSRAELLLGYRSPPEKIRESLAGLGLKPEKEKEDLLTFRVPSFRPDLTREVDLIEEVARLTGFDMIPAVMPVSRITHHKRKLSRTIPARIREICCGLGLDEVITYSFMGPGSLDRLRIPSDHPLRRACEIANPVNKEQGLLRTTLIPGLLEIVERNVNKRALRVAIFEIGRVFSVRGETEPPREEARLSLAIFRRDGKSDWCRPDPILDFFSLKGILETLGRRMNLGGLTFAPADYPIFQDGQSARLMIGEEIIGVAGTVDDPILDSYSLPAPVYLAELEMRPFLEAGGRIPVFRSLDQYPALRRDMALIIDISVPYAKVAEAIELHRPELLEEYSLFDLYSGSPIPEGKKSFAFSLKYRSSYDTLCETTVNKIHRAFQESLISALGCSFR